MWATAADMTSPVRRVRCPQKRGRSGGRESPKEDERGYKCTGEQAGNHDP